MLTETRTCRSFLISTMIPSNPRSGPLVTCTFCPRCEKGQGSYLLACCVTIRIESTSQSSKAAGPAPKLTKSKKPGIVIIGRRERRSVRQKRYPRNSGSWIVLTRSDQRRRTLYEGRNDSNPLSARWVATTPSNRVRTRTAYHRSRFSANSMPTPSFAPTRCLIDNSAQNLTPRNPISRAGQRRRGKNQERKALFG